MRRSINPPAVVERLWTSLRAVCALALLGATSGVGAARAAEAPVTPCDAPAYHQLDFWLGQWRVYDGDSGRLVAKDRIERRLSGCVVEQSLTFVTDMYRRPGVPYRLSGTSTSRFDGERWLQLWVDDQWGAIIMTGAAQADGAMVFDTLIPSRGRQVRLVWRRGPDGTVRILQYVASAAKGPGATPGVWTKYGDLLYRPDPEGLGAPHASSGSSTPCLRRASIKGPRCA